MQTHHGADAVAQLGRGPAAGEHVGQATVKRKVQHARQQRLALVARHVALDLACLLVGKGRVDAKAFAKDVELFAPGAPRHLVHAWCTRVARVHEVGEVVGRHVKGGVDSEGIDTDLAHPEAVALAQGAAHRGVFGVQVVQARHLEVQLLVRVLVVADVRCPVVDAGAALGRVARVVQLERRLAGSRHRAATGVGGVAASRVAVVPAGAVLEEVAGVVDHDVLHQVHAAHMQLVRQPLVVVQAAQVLVHAHEVLGPVAVVAGVLRQRVGPLVGHRRRDPHRRGAQPAYVVQPRAQARQVAAAVLARQPRIELTGALVVVARVAVGKAVGHDEVDDLVAPIGGRHVQFQRRRSVGRQRQPGGGADRQDAAGSGSPGGHGGLASRRRAAGAAV